MREYADHRDDDELWSSMEPKREPVRARLFLPLLLVILIFSVPWYLPEEIARRSFGGLPLWVWTTLLCSAGVSCLTCWASLFWWDDEDPSQSQAAANEAAAPRVEETP